MTKSKQNSIVLSKNREYMKNPMSVVENMGSGSLKQSKIVLKVISRIQANIRDYLDNIEQRKEVQQLCLFSDDEFVSNVPSCSEPVKHWEIPLSEFNVSAKDYNLLEEAARGLSSIIVPTLYDAPQGGKEVRYVPMMTASIPLNDQGSKRRGYVNVYVPKTVARQHWVMNQGYSEHLRNLAEICEKSYTVTLLINMYNWFRQNMSYTIEYNDLRKKMGCTQLDNKGEVIKEKYARFKDFSKRILDPSVEDAKNLFQQGKLDFFFTYTAERGQRTTGEPNAITFHCHNSIDAIEVKEPRKQETKITLPDWVLPTMKAYWRNRAAVVGEQTVLIWYKCPRYTVNGGGIPLIIFAGEAQQETFFEAMQDKDMSVLKSMFGDKMFFVTHP